MGESRDPPQVRKQSGINCKHLKQPLFHRISLVPLLVEAPVVLQPMLFSGQVLLLVLQLCDSKLLSTHVRGRIMGKQSDSPILRVENWLAQCFGPGTH